jgi:antitoxin component of RelBE/YafQ-DinJ toxin-antitoxin module
MKIATFRIDPDLWKKATLKAKKLGRSLSGQIRYLLQKFIDE